MWGAGRNDDGVSRCDIKTPFTQYHASLTGEDVIDLLSYSMPMQLGCVSGWNRRFGQTLIFYLAGIWVQQFTNYRTILGDEAFNIFRTGLVGHGMKCKLSSIVVNCLQGTEIVKPYTKLISSLGFGDEKLLTVTRFKIQWQ